MEFIVYKYFMSQLCTDLNFTVLKLIHLNLTNIEPTYILNDVKSYFL